MSQDSAIIFVIFGLLLRIGIPVGITLLLGWFIRRLDTRWREEAIQLLEDDSIKVRMEPKPQPCWEYMKCPSSVRGHCEFFGKSEIPCWEYFRTNGSLRPSCQVCTYRKANLAKQHAYALSIGD